MQMCTGNYFFLSKPVRVMYIDVHNTYTYLLDPVVHILLGGTAFLNGRIANGCGGGGEGELTYENICLKGQFDQTFWLLFSILLHFFNHNRNK